MSVSLGRSQFYCPRCMTSMLLGHAAGLAVHGCVGCGGVWLGSECAMKFSMALPRVALDLAAKHASAATDEVNTESPIQCPECGKVMHRAHARAAALDLDVCEFHGTWYDKDEMKRVARAIAATRAKMPATPTKSSRMHIDAVDTVLAAACLVVDVFDTTDAGEVIVEGIFGFIGSLFD